MSDGLPAGFGVTLDVSAKQIADDLWFGGSPARILRLTSSGLRAWAELKRGPVQSGPAGRLARRFTDAGLAHPVPPPCHEPGELTVIVPAHDRPDDLDRCLAALGRTNPVVVVDDDSVDPAPVARAAAAHGATLVHRDRNGGPAAARNTGLADVRTEFVAFVDSDCETGADSITTLLGHFADPLVAAVAPRVIARAAHTWSGRYTTARGSLDLGSLPARVLPGARVSYVPTAALVARRTALAAIARDGAVFDETLRVGEDVDLVWRLTELGWRVRYEPSVQVLHREPTTWPQLLARRFRYGTSAAELSRRHPKATVPMIVHPWPALAVAGLLTRRPSVAVAGYTAAVVGMARTLHRAGVPTTGLFASMGRAVHQTWLGFGRYATQFAAPVLIAGIVAPGRIGRRAAAASLLFGPALTVWSGERKALDPARFILGNLADEIAYGLGVWTGCLRAHTTSPVRPVITRRPVRIDSHRN